MRKVYVDHAATTPIHPEAAEKMISVLTNYFGNPSSIHQFGRQARKQLDESREVLAATIGASTEEIILTSGGTEADNLAILGYVQAYKESGNHIITTEIEHHAVLYTCKKLEQLGFKVTYLPVNEEGTVFPSQLQEALTEDTILVSIMHGNNETGSIQPIAELSHICKDHGVAFHTDAVQTYSYVPIDVNDLEVTLLSVSSHKINGPNGAGFLFARKGTRLNPMFTGGEQERKRRAGTENIAAIAGFAEAARIACDNLSERTESYGELSRKFLLALENERISFEVNGGNSHKLSHIINIYIPGIQVESFLVQLDLSGIAASSGSACTAGSVEPSHVLQSMYHDNNRAYSSVRFSFGKGNTEDDVVYIAKEIKKIMDRTNL